MNRVNYRSVLVTAVFSVLCATLLWNCGRPERISPNENCRGGDCESEGPAVAECVEDSDCGEFQVCNNGQCEEEAQVDSCESSSDCPYGQFCDLALDSCVDCLMDDHCEVGLVCQPDGSCGDGSVECASDFDCPTGYVCDAQGQCVAGGSTGGGSQEIPCSSLEDCEVYGRVCEENVCVPCTSDSQCQLDYVCSAGVCTDPNAAGGGTGGLPGAGCTTAYDCPEGQGCFMGLLCGICMMDTDCRSGETCDASTFQCVAGGSGAGGTPGGAGAGGSCNDAYDCAAGEGCLMGVCGLCILDTDCRSGEMCDPGSFSCQ